MVRNGARLATVIVALVLMLLLLPAYAGAQRGGGGHFGAGRPVVAARSAPIAHAAVHASAPIAQVPPAARVAPPFARTAQPPARMTPPVVSPPPGTPNVFPGPRGVPTNPHPSSFIGRPAPVFSNPVTRLPGHAPAVRFRNRPVLPPVLGFYSPYFWPSPVYPIAEPYILPPEPIVQEPAISQNEVELSYQVQRLSDEIENLRQQAAGAPQAFAPAPEPPPAPEPAVPTTIVFRDGRRMDVVNYAIVGQTLWVFNERTSTRYNVADLDLNAIERENRGRGVRFPLSPR